MKARPFLKQGVAACSLVRAPVGRSLISNSVADVKDEKTDTDNRCFFLVSAIFPHKKNGRK